MDFKAHLHVLASFLLGSILAILILVMIRFVAWVDEHLKPQGTRSAAVVANSGKYTDRTPKVKFTPPAKH